MGWTLAVIVGVLLLGAVVLRHRMGPRGPEMSTAQLAQRLGQTDCVVLDVRSDNEYRSGAIPGALHIPYRQVADRLAELEPHRDCDMVVYCAAGIRARIAQNTLTQAGFTRVYHLVGDMAVWTRENRPIETPAAQ